MFQDLIQELSSKEAVSIISYVVKNIFFNQIIIGIKTFYNIWNNWNGLLDVSTFNSRVGAQNLDVTFISRIGARNLDSSTFNSRIVALNSCNSRIGATKLG